MQSAYGHAWIILECGQLHSSPMWCVIAMEMLACPFSVRCLLLLTCLDSSPFFHYKCVGLILQCRVQSQEGPWSFLGAPSRGFNFIFLSWLINYFPVWVHHVESCESCFCQETFHIQPSHQLLSINLDMGLCAVGCEFGILSPTNQTSAEPAPCTPLQHFPTWKDGIGVHLYCCQYLHIGFC